MGPGHGSIFGLGTHDEFCVTATGGLGAARAGAALAFAGFSAGHLSQFKDQVTVAMIQAYNDWHVDDWCATYPGRFIPNAILPLWDPQSFAGHPLYANAQTGLAYPPRLILAELVSPSWVHDLYLMFHMWLGGLAMFAHGYEGEGSGIGTVRSSPLDAHLTKRGYAWAASGLGAPAAMQ